jgi:hypothetical protein
MERSGRDAQDASNPNVDPEPGDILQMSETYFPSDFRWDLQMMVVVAVDQEPRLRNVCPCLCELGQLPSSMVFVVEYSLILWFTFRFIELLCTVLDHAEYIILGYKYESGIATTIIIPEAFSIPFLVYTRVRLQPHVRRTTVNSYDEGKLLLKVSRSTSCAH